MQHAHALSACARSYVLLACVHVAVRACWHARRLQLCKCTLAIIHARSMQDACSCVYTCIRMHKADCKYAGGNNAYAGARICASVCMRAMHANMMVVLACTLHIVVNKSCNKTCEDSSVQQGTGKNPPNKTAQRLVAFSGNRAEK